MIQAFELVIIMAVTGVIATIVAFGALLLLSIRKKSNKA
jgi:hypothetical protein